jgi:hypothetical protein
MLWLAAEVKADKAAIRRVLDDLMIKLCCIELDIPRVLSLLPQERRAIYLEGAADYLRDFIHSRDIAVGMGL